MEQIGLALANRLPYEAKNYFVHQGVQPCLEKIRALYAFPFFGIAYVHGVPRAGKTHLSIKAGDLAASQGLLPRYVEGSDFAIWMRDKLPTLKWNEKDLVIIDDIHLYLQSLGAGESGPFVHFIELLRKSNVKVLLFSQTSMDSLPCDEHVLSRLNPGRGFDIESPADSDMPELVRCMGAQRGISFKERHIEFIVRRIGKDITEIEQYFDRVMHLSQVLGKRIQFPLLGDAV